MSDLIDHSLDELRRMSPEERSAYRRYLDTEMEASFARAGAILDSWERFIFWAMIVYLAGVAGLIIFFIVTNCCK
jgi:hypothetical protein